MRACGRAADERILNLKIGDGMDGVGAADGFGAHFGESDGAYVAGLDQIGDGADGIFDGDGRIAAGRTVDIDVVRAEAFEGVGQEILHGRGPGVEAGPASIGTAQGAELNGNQGLVAAALERPARSISLWPMP